MLVIISGPKGSGKSTIRRHLETKGFQSLNLDDLFHEFDPDRMHTADNPSEELKDTVYEIIKKRAIELSKNHDVVLDDPGNSRRFPSLLSDLRALTPRTVSIFIDVNREIAWKRAQARDNHGHRPFNREYFDTVYDRCQQARLPANLVVANNSNSLESFISKFENLLKEKL